MYHRVSDTLKIVKKGLHMYT